jgi:hypothetical protein
MRVLIALIIIVYLVGVGVVLAPAIETNVDSASASELASRIAQSLPDAVAWPSRAYRALTQRL